MSRKRKRYAPHHQNKYSKMKAKAKHHRPQTSGFQYINLFVFSSILICVFQFLVSFSPYYSRWGTLAILLLFSLYSLTPSSIRIIKLPVRVIFPDPRAINLILLSFMLLQIYYGSRVTAVQTVTPTWFSLAVIIFILLVINSITNVGNKAFPLKIPQNAIEIQPYLISALIVSTLATTRNLRDISSEIRTDTFSKSVIYLTIFTLVTYFLVNWRNFSNPLILKKRFIVWLSILVLNFWLAFRNDTLKSIESSYYHVGYYTDVIKSIRSGGTLLHDAPSQYGFLNLLLLSWIPVADTRQALYIGQATLMFFLVSCVLLVLNKELSTTKSFFGFSLIVIVIFYFSDPDLIGPHVYPSSSAMRFAPSLLYVLSLYLFKEKLISSERVLSLISGTFLVLGSLWSAESLVYCSSIFFFVNVAKIVKLSDKRVKELLTSVKLFLSALLMCFIIVNLYTYLSAGSPADLSMHFMYAFGYSAGFGAIPLQVASPGWIIIFLISFICFKFRSKKNEMSSQEVILHSSILGALLGWFTYFLGRAYPENIIAQFPLISIVSILLLLGDGRHSLIEEHVAEQKERGHGYRDYFPIIMLISIIISSIVGQAKFIPTVLRATSIEQPDIVPSFVAKESAKNLLKLLPNDGKALPIVYEGYAGVLPFLNQKENQQLDLLRTWLPIPLGLLEEPINSDKRKEIIDRFISNNPRSGYILYSIQDSFQDRHTKLMQILSSTHRCTLFAADIEFELIRCDIK